MSYLASGPFLDWEEMTGLSKFWVDIISIPIFSAIAGVLTNWTGVLMLFAPVQFHGFYVPGLKTLFPFFHPKVKVLPCWAPNGVIGFQGIIPSRAEKMASIVVDKSISRIGNMKDFFMELDPEGVADHISIAAQRELRPMVATVMEREHPQLWNDLSPQLREILYQRVEAELPGIVHRAFLEMGDRIDQLIDIKLFVVGYLKRNPRVLRDVIEGLGGPEFRFMVKIGLFGFPFGLILALYLQVHHHIPIVHYIPASWMVLVGAALIGIFVNILAIKVVFEPGDPAPRYKYLWKQAKLAKRQREAAGDFGHALAYQILTLPTIAQELLEGPRSDKTIGMIEKLVSTEVNRVLGPMRSMVRVAVGAREFDSIVSSAPAAALDFAPTLLDDPEFQKQQAAKLDRFATAKLRELPPSEFMEMMYSAVEQDAWLLYVHGGLMGVVVGAIHLLVFGA